MIQHPPLFITSTGTEQGKTFATCLLAKQLARKGKTARIIKPILSGYDEPENSDAGKILQAQGKKISEETITAISPWRFSAPLSPDYAASLEGCEVAFEEVVEFCQHAEVIEGAGGVMSPLIKGKTNLDLLRALQARAVLVSSLYLGCISHILTALEVFKWHQCEVVALVLTPAQSDAMSEEVVLASLKPQLPKELTIFCLKRSQNEGNDWQQQPDLTKLGSK